MGIRREASAVALPLQCAVLLEISHISADDRFAAQIDLSSVASHGEGGFMRRGVARLWSGY